jgi:hypothetical protein
MDKDKQEVLLDIFKVLFEGENRRCRKELDALIEDNNLIKGVAAFGFTFGGIPYLKTSAVRVTPESRPSLSYQLCPRMDQYVADAAQLSLDYKQIRQAITLLCEKVFTWEDLRNALPECLVSCSSVLRAYPRTKEAGFTLLENPRQHKQFLALVTKMEMYFATRLMF